MLENLVATGIAVVVGYLLIRLLIKGVADMFGENRDGGSSVGSTLGGSLMTLDKITRPSIERVERVKEEVRREDDAANDD